jgi:PII-like signaling protein
MSTHDGGVQAGARHTRPGRRLTVLLTMHDHAGRHSLMLKLLERAHKQKVAGATVLEGITGFGSSGTLHETHLLHDDAPLSFIVVDTPERVDEFLRAADDLLGDVVVVTDDVTIHGS